MRNYILLLVILLGFSSCGGFSDKKSKELHFNNVLKDTTCHLFNDVANPSLKLKLNAEIPDDFQDEKVLGLLQGEIIKNLTGDSVANYSDKAIDNYIQKWIKDYKSLEKEYVSIKDTMNEGEIAPSAFNWEVKIKACPIFKSKSLLCYKIENYIFMDGAHGSTIIKAVNMSLKDGKIITLDDVFNDDYDDLLLPSIVEKIKKDNKLKVGDDLESIGYFGTDEMCVSSNFLIEEDGVTFIYNPGEVAAYVVGNVKVKLPFEDLSMAIRSDFLINEYVK